MEIINNMTTDKLDDMAVDCMLKLFFWSIACHLKLCSELEVLSELCETFGVSSPRIKSVEEAEYVIPARPAGDSKHADLLTRYYDALHNDRMHLDFIAMISAYLYDLAPSDVELLAEHYEFGKSYRQIAEERYVSKDTIIARFAKIRREFFANE